MFSSSRPEQSTRPHHLTRRAFTRRRGRDKENVNLENARPGAKRCVPCGARMIPGIRTSSLRRRTFPAPVTPTDKRFQLRRCGFFLNLVVVPNFRVNDHKKNNHSAKNAHPTVVCVYVYDFVPSPSSCCLSSIPCAERAYAESPERTTQCNCNRRPLQEPRQRDR